MAHKATIKELAEAAGVSVTTVSQILNGKGDRFSSDTRKKVRDYQKKLNYVPNFNARNLILNNAKTIGVLVPNIGNPFFSSFIAGIQRVSREFEYLPFNFSGSNDPELENYYMKRLISRGADGMIIASSTITSETLNDTLKKNAIPYLLMDQSPLSDGDQVRTNDTLGGKLVADHLLELGHRNITIVMPENATDNILYRVKGFKAEIFAQDTQKVCHVTTIYRPLTKKGGFESAQAVVDSQATAVFAINDEMAIGLYRGLTQLGYQIPTDVSVIGYDGIDLDEYVSPALTTIQQPISRMGELATELLINRINNPRIEQQVVELPVRLIQRSSTTAPKI